MRFIDLFAGIGGFHLAFHNVGAECVFASEINPYARMTYQANFESITPALFSKGRFNDNILKLDNPQEQIPDFEVLCAGFPCQPFSQAGYKKGFKEDKDDRGNMFFRICEILEAKKPKAFFLENVRHILKHEDGKTFEIIKNHLEENLGYTFHYKLVKASDYGLPQHRPRIFMVGFRKDSTLLPEFTFPKPVKLEKTMSKIWKGNCSRDIGFTLRVGGRGSGLHDRRNWDSYLVDGEERRLTPVQGKEMMGYPESFLFPVSETQALKQLGNSVAVNAVSAFAKQIKSYLQDNDHLFDKEGTNIG